MVGGEQCSHPGRYSLKGVQNKYSRILLIRALVIQIANSPERLGPSEKFVKNSTKLICLEITGYQVKFITVLWLLELQIRCCRKV